MHAGIIDEVTVDQGQTFYHVVFADFDEEELDLGEVWTSVCYHPELDAAKDGLTVPQMPKEGSLVMYALNYDPRIGKVVEIREDLAKPVVVQIWKPKRARRGPTDLVTAKYSTDDTAEDPERTALSLAQIRMDCLHFDENDHLDRVSQKAVKKILKKWRKR